PGLCPVEHKVSPLERAAIARLVAVAFTAPCAGQLQIIAVERTATRFLAERIAASSDHRLAVADIAAGNDHLDAGAQKTLAERQIRTHERAPIGRVAHLRRG